MTRSAAHRFVVPGVFFAAIACVPACSGQEATALPVTDGWGPSSSGGSSSPAAGSTGSSSGSSSGASSGSNGGSTSSSSGSGGGPGPVGGSGSSSGGASSGGAGTTPSDAGAPAADAGSGAPGQGGTAAQGPLGSCTNPICGTDLNECGCQAVDSAGNQIQMGCQAGGQCVCLTNGQVDDQPFDENGACNDPASTAAQFLTNCTCQ